MPALTQEEQQLFADALEQDSPAKRAAFLERSCEGKPGLRAKLEALLQASLDAEALFNTPWNAPDYITQIGHYRLLSRIGEGGHGVVYLAEQQRPVRRTVALKVIRLGMDTEQVIQRFEAERQALALMEHPYIARVLDAGTTDTGRPFFVMERVAGVRITDYCDQHRLSLAQRIELFVKVCHGLQHAHEKSVIHRDIKPSNILVAEIDGQPVPKIIDFGIAKATSCRLTEHTLYTAEPSQFVGTPAYMSPEHARQGGLAVDTRSDIFSLGVLLCDLLVGISPFPCQDWSKMEPEEIRRIVREREPRRPSLLVAGMEPSTRDLVASQRNTQTTRLPGLLSGDLDWVVLRALAKERDQRYETAAALAAELQRFLRHEPVEAGPPSRVYALRKFVRRNKGPVLAASLVLASLVIGLGIATHLYFREQQALRAQIELRRETELARANEALLRQKAETGERIARAAVQISYKRLPEADALVGGLPMELVQPSLESALVFRTLGTWHAQAERWAPAARYLGALASSITEIDSTDTEGVSGQLIPAAAAIVESGQLDQYDQFRRLLLRRFAKTTRPVVAEQVLKSCLLAPADEETLRNLGPLFLIVQEACLDPEAEKDPYMLAWRHFCLGLMEYRRGHYKEALAFQDHCLASFNENHSRQAAALMVKALAHSHQGGHTEAEKARLHAEDIISRESPRLDAMPPLFQGFWFDWVINRNLQRELGRTLGN